MAHPIGQLPPSTSSIVAVQALAGQGRYGTVTRLAAAYGLSRQQVYALRDRGDAALQEVFQEDEAPDRVVLSKATIDRLIVALRVATPSSYRDIEEVLLVALGMKVGYGPVVSVIRDAEERAAAWLREPSHRELGSVALDEMFRQGRPVLAGIDLDHQYLFLLRVEDDRRGDTWARVLGEQRDHQGLSPSVVVKDAGSGLAAGVRRAWPDTQEVDDLFHALLLTNKVRRRLETAAYRAIERVEGLTRKRALAERGTETERLSLDQDLGTATPQLDEAIARFDAFEKLYHALREALEMTAWGSGRLRTPEEMERNVRGIIEQMGALGTREVRGITRYLSNRAAGLARYLGRLGEQLIGLEEAVGGREVVEAAVRLYQANLRVNRGKSAPAQAELRAAVHGLLEAVDGAPERIAEVVGAVFPVLDRRARASSAIENLNSVLRPYLVVQKHAQQGFLDLFRFYWNTRKRQWGRGKGTSPYQSLTGEPIEDWLTLLGSPPGPEQTAVIKRRSLAA